MSEQHLRDLLRKDAETCTVHEAPLEKIRAKIEKGSGKPMMMSQTKKFAYASVASVLLISGVLGSGFISPAMAEVLSKVPLIGYVFDKSDATDAGLRQASKNGFSHEINKSVTDQGINVTLTEMVNDATRLNIAAVFEFPEGVDGSGGIDTFTYSHPTEGAVSLESPHFWSWEAVKGKKNTYTGIFSVPVSEDHPKQYDLHMKIEKLSGVQGNWEFNLLIDRSDKALGTEYVQTHQKHPFNGYTFTVEKLMLAPSAFAVTFKTEGTDLERLSVGKSYRLPDIQVYDDKGNKLPLLKDANGSRMWANNVKQGDGWIQANYLYQPLQHRPEYLIVKVEELVDDGPGGRILTEIKVPVPAE